MCSLQSGEASFELADNPFQVFGCQEQPCSLCLFQPGFCLGQVGAQLCQQRVKIEYSIAYRFFQAFEANRYVRNDMRLLLHKHLIADLLRSLSQAHGSLQRFPDFGSAHPGIDLGHTHGVMAKKTPDHLQGYIIIDEAHADRMPELVRL